MKLMVRSKHMGEACEIERKRMRERERCIASHMHLGSNPRPRYVPDWGLNV